MKNMKYGFHHFRANTNTISQTTILTGEHDDK